MIKANYHTHSKYCKHGLGDIQDYVNEAIKYGLEELGFTSHIPFSKEFIESDCYKTIKKNASDECIKGKESRMEYFELPNYLSDIDDAKHANKIKIYSGLECEYDETNQSFLNLIKSKLDYLILGVHHIFKDGILYDFVERCVVSKNGVRKMTYEDFDIYADSCANGMKSGLFKYLAHPDFFMNKVVIFNDKCREISKKIIESAIENDVVLELNTSDFYKAQKKNRAIRYPRDEFWEIVGSYPMAKVILGTDAHQPGRVCDFRLESINKIINRNNLTVLEKINI